MTGRRNGTIAFVWGAAEAVLWFVVPDVFLTWAAVRYGLRRGLSLVPVTIAGAMVGGMVAYGWGAVAPGAAAQAMASLPAVDAAMVDRVAHEVAAGGPGALMAGPQRTQPYKLYAMAAGDQGAGLVSLLLWTVPGRAGRFVAATLGASLASRLGRRLLPPWAIDVGWAAAWLCLYIVLWS